MGRIHVLSENVANKIAAGEVVERPASVAKELLENSLDAGATRIRIQVEAGGKKIIQITDNGCGMVRDDALLAFERHATSKINRAEDLLSVATLGFRGEALPSIASVSRLRLETRAAEEAAGTVVEINGGKIFKVEEAGLPEGTSIAVRDLFFNIPARKKFLKAESTELSHIASLVTHYALAHPDKHFELHSATNAILVAPPVAGYGERVYQIFGKEVLDQLIPIAALQPLERLGLPQPPPWRRKDKDAQCGADAPSASSGQAPARDQPDISNTAEESEEAMEEAPSFGELRVHGFISKPEIQKLNRNSIYVFVNGRLIRDRLIQHAITEAYRNILPPTVYPVVLLFLALPNGEVDVNVHPSKTEVRFRQQSAMHDFVRDSIRAALMKARPVPQFAVEISAHPSASPSLIAGSPISGAPAGSRAGTAEVAAWGGLYVSGGPQPFSLQAPVPAPINHRFQFGEGFSVEGNAALSLVPAPEPILNSTTADATSNDATIHDTCAPPLPDDGEAVGDLAPALASLKPLGQIRESFILAVNSEGLWIVDQHVAHERVLFEKILKQRAVQKVESQRLLLPLVIELTPAQQTVFTEISDELAKNGFEVEPFGARSVAVKIAPAGVESPAVEHMLHELLDQFSREEQALNLEKIRTRIAASIACHAAIKVNMPLEQNKMEWLLAELAKTDCPMSCPHGRPVVLRYSLKDIQKAFKRI
ncbi:MAG TPA: DNA mismatch repair endonuclease MutL [Terriglobales bacterium]|jgi:DNA mismatch repair protein MutL|nr:DNA mismatch repair endonuclease MutL [Terriglobales bacterium]